MNKLQNRNRVIGILILIFIIIWTWKWIWFYYAYHFTSILWLYMHPDWVILLNILIGVIGFYLGVSLIINRISIKKAIIIVLSLIVFGWIISSLISMFG